MQIASSVPQDKLLNKWYFKNTYLIAIFIFGALPLIAFYLGLLNTEINLIEEVSPNQALPIAIGELESTVSIGEQGQLVSTCTIDTLDNFHVCGYRVILTANVNHPINFKQFDNIIARLNISTPSQTDSIRFQIISFNEAYSKQSNIDTQKYQGVTLDAANGPIEYAIPLGNFEVESWWLYRYNIGMQNALPELDKVTGFVMVHNGFKTTGEYKITLEKMVLQGTLISALTAFFILFFTTLVIIILSTLRHRHLIRCQIELDMLTGALNRAGMTSFLKRRLINPNKPKEYGVIFVDIDDFKNINDSHGHEFGDEVLRLFSDHTTQLIDNFVDDAGLSKLVRISGDEFVILLETDDKEQVKALCYDLCNKFKSPIDTSIGEFTIGLSAGGSHGLAKHKEISHLIKQADDAMYIAKQNGKNQWRFYDDELALQSNVSDPLVNILLEKIDKGNETFLFQPLCHLKTKSLDKVLIDLSPLMSKGIERLVANIAQKSKAKETQAIIIEHLVARLGNILLANKDWLKHSEIGLIFKVLPSFVSNEGVYDIFIKALKQIHPAYRNLVISLPAPNLDSHASGPLDAINAIKRAGFEVGLHSLKSNVACTDMFKDLEITNLMIDASFLKSHLSNPQELVYHLFSFLKALDTALIVEDGMNKLHEINYILSTPADYMSGYLLEPSYCLSDFKTSISHKHND